MIYKPDYFIPSGKFKLVQITCFGEMGGDPYSDKIVMVGDTREELEEYVKKELKYKWRNDSWDDYYIKETK